MVATREQLIDNACTILIDAYEGGSCGIASWAVSYGTYKWADDGKMGTHASVTLYDMEQMEVLAEDDPLHGKEGEGYFNWGEFLKFGEPLYIDHEIIADFIVKVGKGEIDLSKVPEYGRLSRGTMTALVEMYHGMDSAFDDWDCMNADQVVQFILLGEVTYG